MCFHDARNQGAEAALPPSIPSLRGALTLTPVPSPTSQREHTKKLEEARQFEDPRLSFSTPEFKEASRIFTEQCAYRARGMSGARPSESYFGGVRGVGGEGREGVWRARCARERVRSDRNICVREGEATRARARYLVQGLSRRTLTRDEWQRRQCAGPPTATHLARARAPTATPR